MLASLSGFAGAVPTDTLLLRRCAAASGLGAGSGPRVRTRLNHLLRLL